MGVGNARGHYLGNDLWHSQPSHPPENLPSRDQVRTSGYPGNDPLGNDFWVPSPHPPKNQPTRFCAQFRSIDDTHGHTKSGSSAGTLRKIWNQSLCRGLPERANYEHRFLFHNTSSICERTPLGVLPQICIQTPRCGHILGQETASTMDRQSILAQATFC